VVLFWLVTIGAGLCYVAAMGVVVIGWRSGLAEIGILGAALAVQSQLALVHGLTAPGVLYAASNAVSTSVFVALPVALVVAVPVLARRSRISRAIARAWRGWALGWMAASAALFTYLLARPDGLPAPMMGEPVPMLVGVTSLAVALILSWRQLGLYWVGRRRASLLAALAWVSLGTSGLVWLGDHPFSVGWWLAHLLDISGVTAAAIALAVGYRSRGSIAAAIAPVVNRDPLVALDLGLSPVVNSFVAALEAKDTITRDHVVRVAELAVRAGELAGLRGTRLRHLGLGALLHDIGKLTVPDEVLTKPGRLSPDETTRMKQHVIDGEQLLLTEPQLAPAATVVRWHHERYDGAGYPDGIAGADLPLEVGIVSACDAFDAMAHTRHYREGLGAERAIAVLQQFAGSQWDPRAVELITATVASGAAEQNVLADVGRPGNGAEIACGCLDALPAEAQAKILASV
jgi:HD-GYP domain-containing protein (c-di-GMP phosphodiesterase class II)